LPLVSKTFCGELNFYLENEFGKVVVVVPAAGVADEADDSALLLAPDEESGS